MHLRVLLSRELFWIVFGTEEVTRECDVPLTNEGVSDAAGDLAGAKNVGHQIVPAPVFTAILRDQRDPFTVFGTFSKSPALTPEVTASANSRAVIRV